MIRVFIKFP